MTRSLFSIVLIFFFANAIVAQPKTDKVLFGVAYYDEYMPYDRLEKDVKMMRDAGINVVRIAESTWSTEEPQDNVFDFSHIDRVLNAMHKAGISVIIGTPTYAVPAWLVKKYPAILAETPSGKNKFGARQNMDITNPHFLFHAERIIRKMLAHVKDHPAIIGYQIDNETKSYHVSGPNAQQLFVQYMKHTFHSLDAINKKMGLDYWSNRINSWEEFPSTDGAINASLSSEYAKFQRKLVTDYLGWQAGIVREYKKSNQFITQNFDLEWRGYSYGVQPDVDHFAAAKSLDIAGIDIYHPTQDQLTGIEISLGGDMARSMKEGKNYFVIETEAQGFAQWVPYPEQLRLQAFSHLASGANMVSYWHWHSTHNGIETYWKGLLSQDFEPNPTYNEAISIGKDLEKIGDHLVNLKKKNKAAILFSNEALTAFESFGFGWGVNVKYNDILRPFYDALYKMNVGVDFVDPTSKNLEDYSLLIVPALYAAPDSLLLRLNNYVKNGGHIVYTYKSGFSDENVKVRSTVQPAIINEACGISYSQFTIPNNVSLKADPFQVGAENNLIHTWMELITPTTANVLAYYDHPVWGKYAAITENKYGKGLATYIGCITSNKVTEQLMTGAVKKAGIAGPDQKLNFPLITKSGSNQKGKNIHYYFNYSANPISFEYPYPSANDLLNNTKIATNEKITLNGWGFTVLEEN
jgi:beta-galactosidase